MKMLVAHILQGVVVLCLYHAFTTEGVQYSAAIAGCVAIFALRLAYAAGEEA